MKTKRKRSDSTKISKGQSDNTNDPTKSSTKQRLRTDLGQSDGVTTATQLVWFTGCTDNQLVWFKRPLLLRKTLGIISSIKINKANVTPIPMNISVL